MHHQQTHQTRSTRAASKRNNQNNSDRSTSRSGLPASFSHTHRFSNPSAARAPFPYAPLAVARLQRTGIIKAQLTQSRLITAHQLLTTFRREHAVQRLKYVPRWNPTHWRSHGEMAPFPASAACGRIVAPIKKSHQQPAIGPLWRWQRQIL
jgi:hypothetical protein